jgi:hypothetical protein
MALYLMGVYSNPMIETWFKTAFKKAGKKLDMGKSCVRFKAVDDLPLEVIGETIAKVPVDKFLAVVERSQSARKKTATKARPKAKAKAKPKAKRR